MIRSFGNGGTGDVFHGRSTKAARRVCPQVLWRVAQRRLDLLHAAKDERDLAGVDYERLKGKWKGWSSIRINDQYRIVFRWVGGDAEEVTIGDYH